jgi:uncharacterized membrane protein HdeD (DUF308 family)
MNIIKSKIKSMYRTSIAFSIVLFLVGIFLLIKPEVTLHAISYLVGIMLIIWGIVPVISFFTDKDNNNYLEFSFICGVFALIFGIIVMLNPDIIGSIIPLLVGIWMIINGVTKLQYAIMLKRNEADAFVSITLSLIILLCGILLIFNPFGGAIVITKLIGIFLIIYSILDIIECYSIKKTVKTVEKKVNKDKDNIIEAKYEEE